MGASLLATRPHSTRTGSVQADRRRTCGSRRCRPEARRDVDYALLDQRLKQLMTKPAMVGLAVGVVENGRITFLRGYGETLAGSGDPVTPDTVFRWASVSKGVAATMVAKLAEQGKIDLKAPVANYAPDLKLPAQATNIARPSATCCRTASASIATPTTTSSRRGRTRASSGRSLATLNAVCAPGTCWTIRTSPTTRRARWSSRVTRPAVRASGQALSVQSDRDDQRQRFAGGPASRTRAGRGRTAAGGGRWPMVDTYYKVPGAAGVNSNIKDMALWMVAQMGEMPDVLDGQVLDTIHAPYVVTPSERGRLRKFLERLGTAWYGYGWRSYDYAGHRIVGHRGGINGYRSLILFDPAEEERRGRAVEQRHQPARRARVRGDGHDLSPAVPRLAGAGQARPGPERDRDRADEVGSGDSGRRRKRQRRRYAAPSPSASAFLSSRCWSRWAL